MITFVSLSFVYICFQFSSCIDVLFTDANKLAPTIANTKANVIPTKIGFASNDSVNL